MFKSYKDIEETVGKLFNQLQEIEQQIKEQEDGMEKARSELSGMTEVNKELINAMRVTRTTVELLRDEIEEIHQVMMELFKGSNRKEEESGGQA